MKLLTGCLQDSEHLTNLENVTITENGITSIGLKYFAEALKCSYHLSNLKSLNFGGNEIDSEGMISFTLKLHFLKISKN
jgi:Leucine-rich repeat (LRR) protein